MMVGYIWPSIRRCDVRRLKGNLNSGAARSSLRNSRPSERLGDVMIDIVGASLSLTRARGLEVSSGKDMKRNGREIAGQ